MGVVVVVCVCVWGGVRACVCGCNGGGGGGECRQIRSLTFIHIEVFFDGCSVEAQP